MNANANPLVAKPEHTASVSTCKPLRELEHQSIVEAHQKTRGKIYGLGSAAELLGLCPTPSRRQSSRWESNEINAVAKLSAAFIEFCGDGSVICTPV
jgi:hypothetical protein